MSPLRRWLRILWHIWLRYVWHRGKPGRDPEATPPDDRYPIF